MKLPGGDDAFVPSIVDLTPEEADQAAAPPPGQGGLTSWMRMRLRRLLRREAAGKRRARSYRHNPAGAKVLRRWAKNATGARHTYAEALEWYTNLK